MTGLIPAHAGKTTLYPAARPAGRAHPRSRGENVRTGRRRPSAWGSSPLTRGKPIMAKSKIEIPVAHPRSRGENQDEDAHHRFSHGSSPLTRGKRRWRRRATCVIGLIPAHAGKTACISCARCRSWAHPRSRGENEATRRRRSWGLGSSPLTRGKLLVAGNLAAGVRLIPAHAGKTWPSQWL